MTATRTRVPSPSELRLRESRPASVEDALHEHTGLVHRLAKRLFVHLPSSVELDDLIQAGLLGLIEAQRRFDHTHGVLFTTFAGVRIRGAMLDELRRADWMTRRARKSRKGIESATRLLHHQLLRPPVDSEIAAKLGLSLLEYRHLLASESGLQMVRFSDLPEDFDMDIALDGDDVDRNLMWEAIESALATLPPREQGIMDQYYARGMTLKQIASAHGVTESRICQLHSRAVSRMQARLAPGQGGLSNQDV